MREWGTDDDGRPDRPWVRIGLGAFAVLLWAAMLWSAFWLLA